MRADVCNCLFTIPLIAVRLPDILLPYLHGSEVRKLVPVEKEGKRKKACGGLHPGYGSTPRPKEPGLCFSGVGVQQRLTPVIRRRWEQTRGSAAARCCRGQCRPEQVQPPPPYLCPPRSKSAESGVKKCLQLAEVKDLETDNY